MILPSSLHVVGAALVRGDRVLAARRGPGMRLAGRWELPGGKVEVGELPGAALARELDEELGVRARVGAWLGRGDEVARGRRIVLDVYEVSLAGGRPRPREHDAVRWIGARELERLDWAAADVPLLPALRARLTARRRAACEADAAPALRRAHVLAADWSGRPGRRAVAEARRGADGWRLAPLPPPEEGAWSLERLVARARALRDASGLPVLVPVDAALGVPAALARAAGAAGFRDWLVRLEAAGGLGDAWLCDKAADFRARRPFFRVPAGRGGMSAYVAAAGGRTGLLRQVELRCAASPAFAVSGIPGAVGGSSRALWRELAPRLRRPPARRGFAVWPFEGGLGRLARRSGVVLMEAFPRLATGVALASVLPAAPERLAKTRPAARRHALARLRAAPWRRAAGVAMVDTGRAAACEDAFDALLSAAALVRLLAEERAPGGALVDARDEGGLAELGGVVAASAPPALPKGG